MDKTRGGTIGVVTVTYNSADVLRDSLDSMAEQWLMPGSVHE